MKAFAIPEENMESLRKKLVRIRNKCAKYGCSFEYREVGTHMGERTIKWDELNEYGGLVTRSTIIPVKYYDIEVEGKAEINGWKFVASLEHTDAGNVIYSIGDLEVPHRYYDCAPYCEHCRTNRARKDSFIIYNQETQEFKQVGKSCLRDYTFGMSAEAVSQYEQAFKEAQEASDSYTWGGFIPYVKTLDYAAFVAETIRIYGYVKRDNYAETPCTADIAYDLYRYVNDMVRRREEREYLETLYNEALSRGWDKDLTNSRALAETVIAWILNNERDDNYFHNLKVACSGEYIECREHGLVASAFPAYNRQLEWDAERRDREAKQRDEAAASTWAGNVGDRVSFKLADFSVITSWETQWGTTFVYKLKDSNGLTYTWKTSNHVGEWCIDREVKGTIKELKEFRGVKQTELTRCKIA